MNEEVILSSMYTHLLSELQIWIRLQTERFGFLPRSAAEQFHEITAIQERDMKNLNPCFASALKKAEFTYTLIWVCTSLLRTFQMEISLLT